VAVVQDKGRTNAGMLVFGHGDGGGGPDRGMLERLRRLKNVDGMPRVQIKPPVDFFTRIAADAHRMVVWVGELVHAVCVCVCVRVCRVCCI
jgi:alpha-mannosidase